MIIIISMLVGLGITFSGIDPIKTLVYSAIFNGIVAPVMLFFIVALSSNKKVMGRYVNSKKTKIIGYSITALMGMASLTTLYLLFFA